MRLRAAQGLRAQLIAALVAVSTLTLGVAALTLLPPLQRRLTNDQLSALGTAVRASLPRFERLERDDLHPRSPALDALVRALRTRARAQVIVAGPTGAVLVATDLDQGEQLDDIRQSLRSDRIVRGRTRDDTRIAWPLEVRGGARIVVALRKSLSETRAAARVVRRAFALAAVIGLGFAVAIGVLLATRLARRLRALRAMALSVAELGPAVEVATDDSPGEVGDLTRAIAAMQTRLREQEQARRTFVATASHELRTPLTSLRMMLELLDEDLDAERPDLADARMQVTRSRAQTERLARLAANLLDLSRLDAGLPLRREPVELGELGRAVLAEFQLRAAEHDGALDLEAQDPTWVSADPGAVAQVVRILLDNALRHGPPGGAVRVIVAGAGDVALLTVADAGPGVPQVDRERIFARFERGSATADAGGFGLGLAIGRDLARRMGGDLQLEPDGPGARFTLRLPAPPPAHAEAVAGRQRGDS